MKPVEETRREQLLVRAVQMAEAARLTLMDDSEAAEPHARAATAAIAQAYAAAGAVYVAAGMALYGTASNALPISIEWP